MYQHIHPLAIFQNLWRVFYLIVIPVLRGFFSALQGGLAGWIQGAWIDILIFLLMIGFAVARWWLVTYRFDREGIHLRAGILYRRHTRIPWRNVTTLSAVERWYLRPFGAARVRAETLGGGLRNADFSVLLSRKKAEDILKWQREQDSGAAARHYIPGLRSILALSLLTSNSLVGILFISTFISQSGRLLGNEFSDMLIGTFQEVARVLAVGIPPAAAAIACVLVAGWFIAFLTTFLRYKNFKAVRRGEALVIDGGALTHREYRIRCRNINFVDIRQSIFTKVLRLYSLYISAVGYGKHKDDISCVIPAESHRDFQRHLGRMFPGLLPATRQYKPKKTGFMRFIGPPLTICAAIPLATLLIIWRVPSWSSFIRFVGLMSMVPAVFFLVVRIFEFVNGGIAREGDVYTLFYSVGFYLHTVVIPAEKIISVEIEQGFYQKFTPNCDLVISTRAEGRAKHRCRNLDKREMQELFGMGG